MVQSERYNGVMGKQYQAIYFELVTDFLKRLPKYDRVNILAGVSKMEEGDFQSAYIKTLHGPVKELIVKQYRIIFFIHEHTIYLVRTFVKKSKKTPRNEIAYVERVYKMFTNNT